MINATQTHQIAELLRRLDHTAAESVLAELEPAWQQPIRELIAQESTCVEGSLGADEDPTIALLQLLETVLVEQRDNHANQSCSDGPGCVVTGLCDEQPFASTTDADLISILRNEYPQTAAVCLACLAPERAASLLGQLGDTQGVEVFKRLRDLTIEDESLVREVCEEVVTNDREPQSCSPQGLAKAEAILQKIPPDLRREFLNSLAPAPDSYDQAACNATEREKCTGLLDALRQDAGLASLEFNRLCGERWAVLDPLIECLSPETLHRAMQGLDFVARQTLTERLPDAIQLRIKVIAAEKKPLVVGEIHAAQVEILKQSLDSEGYRLATLQGKKRISVAV